jgi:hypothetical protein
MGGFSGPPPKRSEERRRRNKDAVDVEKVNLDELITQDVEIPTTGVRWVEDDDDGRIVSETYELDEPVPAWEPLTLRYWEAFKRSGQSIFYEPTDWMTAYALMEFLDRWLKPQDVKVGQIGSLKDESGGGDITYVFEPKIMAMPGSVITAFLSGLGALMATEGDRRKLRIELERKRAIDKALEDSGVVVPISKTRDERFKRESS